MIYIAAAEGQTFQIADPEGLFRTLPDDLAISLRESCERHLLMITCPLLIPNDPGHHTQTIDGLKATVNRLAGPNWRLRPWTPVLGDTPESRDLDRIGGSEGPPAKRA